MLKVGRMTLLLIGMSFSATGLADDAEPATTGIDELPPATLSIHTMYNDWDLGSRWRLPHPVETPTHTYDWSRPGVNVAFQDSDTLTRVSKLRNLSLLTFAEFGRARLFLGVDNNGIVGVHFRAFHRVGDERYFEVVRMPYLNKDEPDHESE